MLEVLNLNLLVRIFVSLNWILLADYSNLNFGFLFFHMKNDRNPPHSMMKNFIIFQYINFSYHKMQVSARYKCAPTFPHHEIFHTNFSVNVEHYSLFRAVYTNIDMTVGRKTKIFLSSTLLLLTFSFPNIQHKIYTHLMRNEGSKRKRK